MNEVRTSIYVFGIFDSVSTRVVLRHPEPTIRNDQDREYQRQRNVASSIVSVTASQISQIVCGAESLRPFCVNVRVAAENLAVGRPTNLIASLTDRMSRPIETAVTG